MGGYIDDDVQLKWPQTSYQGLSWMLTILTTNHDGLLRYLQNGMMRPDGQVQTFQTSANLLL